MAEPEPWEDDEPEGPVRKFMYVNRRAPYGTIYALESLEVVLIAAAFEQGDRLVVVQDSGALLHIPAADWDTDDWSNYKVAI